MSLSFDLSKIENCEKLLDKDRNCLPLTKAVVFNCLGIGLGKITAKNLHEVVRRTALREDVDGSSLTTNTGTPVFLTEEDIRRHIGLTTNVADETARAWETKLGQTAVAQMQRLGRMAREAAQLAKE